MLFVIHLALGRQPPGSLISSVRPTYLSVLCVFQATSLLTQRSKLTEPRSISRLWKSLGDYSRCGRQGKYDKK